jgi:hypothetical protein
MDWKRKPPRKIEGREKALREQFEKDRITKRENQKKIDAEYIRAMGPKGWLQSPPAEPTHQKIPMVPGEKMPTPIFKKAGSSVSITNLNDALAAITGSGTILTLSYKTDITTVKDGATNRKDDFGTYATSVDDNNGELESVRGHLDDIESYFNELSNVLGSNALPHDLEDDAAVKADEIRSDVGSIENMAQELKEKLEQAAAIIGEAEELAGTIIGHVTDTAEKADNLAELIISMKG